MKAAEEAIVVGGGIAGLAVAIALRQRGVEALVLERAPALFEIGAGLLLAPNACAVLDRLGALPHLRAGNSVEAPRWDLLDQRGRQLAALSIAQAGETSLSTRRSDLQEALRRLLPEEALRLDCEVTGVVVTGNGVELVLAGGERLTARRIIVADGAHSSTVATLWPNRRPRYRGYIGWRGLVEAVPEEWRGGRVSESWGRGRRFGIAAVGGGKCYLYASANVPGARCRERVSLKTLREDFRQWHRPVPEILEAMTDRELLQHPIEDRFPSRPWRIGEKAVLLGDAAHPLTPNLGQGAAMALEDAWELASMWNRKDAMEHFETRRAWRIRMMWALSRSLGTAIQWENPLLCGIRDASLRILPDTFSCLTLRSLLRHVPAQAEAR